jgi:hypothetical protein|mmetsp:Transcript_5493/g.12757  ORF Transcript_5493/g.12757 Transcript_5493/m.12757 type:complete len:110 (-) Transcript_5493:296-625(-)
MRTHPEQTPVTPFCDPDDAAQELEQPQAVLEQRPSPWRGGAERRFPSPHRRASEAHWLGTTWIDAVRRADRKLQLERSAGKFRSSDYTASPVVDQVLCGGGLSRLVQHT